MSTLPRPESYVRVMFGQVSDEGYVTASLVHSIGPLIEGETVIAYEVDGGEMLYGPATVARFDDRRGVAYLEVDSQAIRVATSTNQDRPWEHLNSGDEILQRDHLAILA